MNQGPAGAGAWHGGADGEGEPMQDLRTDLSVHRHGRTDPEAPLLLLLHGLTDSGAGWPEAVEQWGARYAILSVDQRGHGESPRFTAEQLEGHPGEVMVQDAVDILEQLRPAPVVVGHSLGGAVALTVAVRRPDLVRAVVLEDPAPLGPGERQGDPMRGEEFLAGARESLAAADEEELIRVRKARHPTWSASELLASGRGEQQVDLAYLAHGDFKPTTRWPELFSEVRVPTLVVTGDQLAEVCIDDAIGRGIQELGNPRVVLVRIPDAGHCIRREQPAAFYAAVDEWLAAV